MTGLDAWAAQWGVNPAAVQDLKQQMGIAEPPVKLDAPPMSEAAAQQQIRIEAPKRGIRLWRNNNGATMDETDRLIRYGLANDSAATSKAIKSSDLIVISPVQILPNHIGLTFAVVTSSEVTRLRLSRLEFASSTVCVSGTCLSSWCGLAASTSTGPSSPHGDANARRCGKCEEQRGQDILANDACNEAYGPENNRYCEDEG